VKPLSQIALPEKIQCLSEALHYWNHRETMTYSDRVTAAESLGEWGLFDVPSIAKIVDLDPDFVAEFVKPRRGKTLDLNPEHLPELLDVAKTRYATGAIDWEPIDWMINRGTSAGAIQRFTGINQGWISRKLRNMQGIPFEAMDAAKRSA